VNYDEVDPTLTFKACITSPTAAGRFLIAGGFTGLSLCHKSNCRRPIFSCRWFHQLAAHFSTSYGCSSNLAWKKCGTYVAVWVQTGRYCGAARHGSCKSCGGSCAPDGHFRRLDGFRFSQLSPAGA
jgi:hypothetical protein